MKLVKQNYNILAASFVSCLPYSYNNNNKLIEVAGRTCYKSEDKITKESSEKFIEMLRSRNHLAVIEHSWEIRKYKRNKIERSNFLNFMECDQMTYVSGNLRAFEEWECDQKDDYYLLNENDIYKIYNKKRLDMLSATVKIITNRAVSHELIRHRPASYAQESTRYCNYNKDKFGSQLSFIIPSWTNLSECNNYRLKDSEIIEDQAVHIWLKTMEYIENSYILLINLGWNADRARGILPNDLKTEIIVTANLMEWKHIFELRTSPEAHRQIREIMIPLQSGFKKLFPGLF